VQALAAVCLEILVNLLLRAGSGEGALPQHAAAAQELADVLLDCGAADSGPQQGSRHQDGGCSCGFVASISRSRPARRRGPASSAEASVLRSLAALQQGGGAAGEQLPTDSCTQMQDLALLVAAARRPGPGAGGASGSSSSISGGGAAPSGPSARGAVPCCADLSFFLGEGWEADASLLPETESARSQSGVNALMAASKISHVFVDVLDAPGRAACPCCLPRQLLLVLEGATAYCGTAATLTYKQEWVYGQLSFLLDHRYYKEAWKPWLLPSYAQPAMRTLTAWLVAAAQLLGEGGPLLTAALAPAAAKDRRALVEAIFYGLGHAMLQPYGVLAAHDLHRDVPMQQLLGIWEQLLRMWSRDHKNPDVSPGFTILEVGGPSAAPAPSSRRACSTLHHPAACHLPVRARPSIASRPDCGGAPPHAWWACTLLA
jgi:hypothetical protein